MTFEGVIQFSWKEGTLITYEGRSGVVISEETTEEYMRVRLHHKSVYSWFKITEDNWKLISLMEPNPYDLEPLE